MLIASVSTMQSDRTDLNLETERDDRLCCMVAVADCGVTVDVRLLTVNMWEFSDDVSVSETTDFTSHSSPDF